MEYKDKQFLMFLARAQYQHARIVSGVYKSRKVFKGLNGPEFTEEEKLKDEVEIMNRHIQFAQDCLDNS